ncbi:Thioredoxin reductase sirT [Lasiodiplodia theobromae]|uniref:Thioredoxin reductase sirT n=1 Tax=Lasiodiplodia theobromae TaxID=45133 RepID=A0A5N5D704_9PEZI|nr:Thioredoxin reductase sirT [Lasiodiplodia theobromae]
MPVGSLLDVLIIGAGPAGLSAALSMGRVLRSAVVFDSKSYRNSKSSNAHTVPTRDHEDPAAIREMMKKELTSKYKTITFAESTAKSVQEVDGGYQVVDENTRKWNARKLIIATGVYDVLPNIPGFSHAWGKGVFHCLYCRGFEEAGASNAAVVINRGDQAEIDITVFNSQLAHQFTRNLTILLNGHEHLFKDSKIKTAVDHGVKINSQAIRRIEWVGPDPSTKVVFDDGTEETFGFLIHTPETKLVGSFHETLNLELTSAGDIAITSPFQDTSRPGVFACGDCATGFKKVAFAMADGIRAGMGANLQIMEEDFSRSWW